ncbi:right-handed parallel beta-helix repeat-containing protein [Actinomadura sp. KC216]|uniref:DUF6519 domain-containing protein n=1 Tax=Actinomadura sp. KC216 TaxID=2530370 RepID=UPI00104497B6|nr:DUF6519 domain-containing protein [Actinomadura sp. KC216]TDB87416.1 right-handed parallel beta-helix repeat-containing protein [Actinomadura sp. KC216]
MSADLSRVRFDALRDFSGVRIQQGRVWLDADFNEQVAITDRRFRAQMVDLAPQQTAVSRQTPDAFEITLSGGKMSIGAGRMYVDGLVAENHGDAPVFDPVLAEPNGTGGTEYGSQPYWPTPEEPPGGGPHLVYLDVWERERTHLNTPDLVDSAIGVDTTTRAQIVWQVRVLPGVGTDVGGGCDQPFSGWDELTAPSPLRLTTGTEAVDPVTDPCEIPPGTGYRGPENHLYRVEMHSPTQFTWSRDNAAFGAAVAEVVSATTLRLHSLGRDDQQSIKDGDWVEITDDARELAQASGEMRQVTVDVAASTITFTPALPAELTGLDHHLRVRKWDSPLITVPADGSPVSLEHGITVAFTSTGSGTARPGDHWVFAARASAPTPEQSLEKLTGAPPRGIHHHYARLALVTFPDEVQDCRPQWPVPSGGGGCACEVCVTPEQHNELGFTIQDALDRLRRAGGGTLTLCPGTYRLDEPLELGKMSSVRVRGSGNGTWLRASRTALVVRSCFDIELADFRIVCDDHEDPGVVLAHGNESVVLERLRIDQPGGPALALSDTLVDLSVSDCVLSGLSGIAAWASEGSPPQVLTVGLSVENTRFSCQERGIDLDVMKGELTAAHGGRTSIRGNTLVWCEDAGIVLTGLVPQDDGDLRGDLDIRANTLQVEGKGIVTGRVANVRDNTVVSRDRREGADGIAVLPLPPDTANGTVAVTGNTVTGFAESGIAVTAAARSLIVQHNTIRRTGAGIVVEPGNNEGAVSVHDNQIVDLRPSPGGADDRASGLRRLSFTVGVLVMGADLASVADNMIDGVGAESRDAARDVPCIGIGMASCQEGRISGNTVSRVGMPGEGTTGHGIAMAGWRGTISVSDNIVTHEPDPESVTRPGWRALTAIISEQFTFAGMRFAATPAESWLLTGDQAHRAGRWRGHLELARNTLHGGGVVNAVSIQVPGEVVMTANRCTQPDESDAPVVHLAAGLAIVQGNRLAGGGRPSMTMDVDPDAASVQGNITSGGIDIRGTAVENTGEPWADLNPIA